MALKLRFIILIITTLCLSFILANVALLNFAKNCMRSQDIQNATSNSSVNSCKYRFFWSDNQEGTLLSAVAWGNIVAGLPASWLFHKFGVSKVFIGFGFLSGLVTGLMALTTFLTGNTAFYGLLVGRILQGVAVGSVGPGFAAIITEWAQPHERGLFIGVIATCREIGPFIANPVAGQFCHCSLTGGWPMAYLIFGIMTLLMFTLWFTVNRYHSNDNLRQRGASNEIKRTIPVKSMLTYAPVLAIVISAVPFVLVTQFLIMYTPSYFTFALGYVSYKSGIMAAIPSLVHLIIKVAGGVVSDKVSCCNETIKVKLFNSLAFFGCAGFLLVLGFVGTNQDSLASLLLIAGIGMLGFYSGGLFKAIILVGGQYSTFIMACIQIQGCMALAVVPFIVNGLIPFDQMRNEENWRNVFILCSSLQVAGNIVFCLFGSGNAAPWTKTNIKIAYGSANNEKEGPATEV